MTREPKSMRCEIRECGAWVFVLPLEGGTVAVDPDPLEVIVRNEDGECWRVSGYQPHAATCVDISGRVARGGK